GIEAPPHLGPPPQEIDDAVGLRVVIPGLGAVVELAPRPEEERLERDVVALLDHQLHPLVTHVRPDVAPLAATQIMGTEEVTVPLVEPSMEFDTAEVGVGILVPALVEGDDLRRPLLAHELVAALKDDQFL